jgi:hypothetical protein
MNYRSALLTPRIPEPSFSKQKSADVRGPFEKFVDWRQCDIVIQREAVTVMPSCSGGGNVVVA